ncbi:MAG: hypothetical protein H0X66_15260 [Verrucomicrobia bacterium]|nr:hypothetical protein [Verrucomicrobiota bacterium]
MRFFSTILGCVLIILSAGCATQRQVAQMEGRGAAEVYNASFNEVWRAAIDAAQIGDLQVQTVDRERGYIAAGRGMRLATHGENVGIWVRQVSPSQTEVEVVSRQAGPPKLWFKNWQNDIFNSISANLTREIGSAPIISEPAGSTIDRGEGLIMEPVPISPPPPVYQQVP